MSDFNFDLREFKAAFAEVAKSGRQTGKKIVNRAGLVAIIGGKGVQGAIQLTPKASKGAISGIDRKKVEAFIASKLRRQGKKFARGKGGRDASGRFTANGGGSGVTAAEFKAMVDKEIKKRLRSVGYTAGPGWNNAARGFGGRGVKGVQSGFAKTKARLGGSTKATDDKLEATMTNTAPAADAIGRDALQQGLNNAARDMVTFHRKKMAETLAKNSAK